MAGIRLTYGPAPSQHIYPLFVNGPIEDAIVSGKEHIDKLCNAMLLNIRLLLSA
jgi:hypothetical protein